MATDARPDAALAFERGSVLHEIYGNVLAGRNSDFASEPEPPVVDAQALVDILYSMDVDTSRGKAGLRIRGARLVGAFSIAGAAGRGGSALPGVTFEDCVIEDVLDISDANLFSFSIRGSKFRGLLGRGVVVAGELDLSNTEPLKDGEPAFVNIRSGRVAGNIYARSARLFGLSERDDRRHGRAEEFAYALRLTETHVGNSIYLTDGVYAEGGVVIRDSVVGGNIWADGAKMFASDGYAFSVRGSRIEGGVRLADGFEARGAVCARQAHIGGSLRFDGGSFTAWKEPMALARTRGVPVLFGVDRAIDAERVTVNGDVSFGMPGEHSEDLAEKETVVRGDVSFAGATVTGDFSWSNLTIAPQVDEREPIFFNFEAMRVDRRLRAHDLTDDLPKRDDGKAAIVIRLRAATASLLQDVWRRSNQGPPREPWGSSAVQLQLDGFRYTLESTRDVKGPSTVASLRKLLARKGPDRTLKRRLWRAQALDVWRGFLAKTLRIYPGPAKARLQWLERMYPKDRRGRPVITRETFISQPYAQAATAFFDVGLDDDAREIQLQKLRYIRKTGRLLRYPLRKLYDLLFGYGIKPMKAFRTLVLAFLIGWFGVWRANTGGMLELNIQPTAEFARVAGAGLEEGATIAVIEEPPQAPCGDEINNALYALDVFIPLVDLRQDSECEIPSTPVPVAALVANAGDQNATIDVETWKIFQALGAPERLSFERPIGPLDLSVIVVPTDKPDFWRFARAIYALAGWVLLSLSILTFSGVLRPRN